MKPEKNPLDGPHSATASPNLPQRVRTRVGSWFGGQPTDNGIQNADPLLSIVSLSIRRTLCCSFCVRSVACVELLFKIILIRPQRRACKKVQLSSENAKLSCYVAPSTAG